MDDLFIRNPRDSEGSSPGPGYYNPKSSSFDSRKGFSFHGQNTNKNSKAIPNFSSPKSPRLTPTSSHMRGDVLFYKTEQNDAFHDSLGPGAYYHEASMVRKSFNTRVLKQPQRPKSAGSMRKKGSSASAGGAGYFPMSPIATKTTGSRQSAFETPQNY